MQKEKEAREAKTVVPTPKHLKDDQEEAEGPQLSLEERLDDLCKGRNQIRMSRPERPTAAKKLLQRQIVKSMALVKKAGAAQLANSGRGLTEMQYLMMKASAKRARGKEGEIEKGLMREYLTA